MKRTAIRLAKIELDFLLRKPLLSGASPIRYEPTAPPISVPEALENLKKIVHKGSKCLESASNVFQQNPSLHKLPAANGLLIKACLQEHDFSTAHALVLRSIEYLHTNDIIHFLVKSFDQSENSRHIISVFEAMTRRAPPLSAYDQSQIAAYTLIGLKLLQETDQYTKIKQWCHVKGLDRNFPLLQVQLFNLYLEQRYDEALELSRVVKSRAADANTRHLLVPYRWALLYAARHGNIKMVAHISQHMHEIGQKAPSDFTNIALGYLPEQFPETSPVEWFEFFQSIKWPITPVTFLIMIDHITTKYPRIAGEIWGKCDQFLGDSSRRRPVPRLQSRHSPFLRKLRRSIYDQRDLEESLGVFHSLRRRGVVPSYEYYVHLFEAMVKAGKDEGLNILKRQMVATNYPLHCAGIDLAVLERQLLELDADKHVHASKQVSKLLVEEYLAQYPLNIHDIVHLTRIAHIYWHYLSDADAAAHVLEFQRLCCTDQRYSTRNHDTVSLTLLVRVLTAEKSRKLDEWLIQVLADSPALILDFEFRRALRVGLKDLQSDLRSALLEKVKDHNKKISRKVFDQVDLLASSIVSPKATGYTEDKVLDT